jgi:hypothetical protein
LTQQNVQDHEKGPPTYGDPIAVGLTGFEPATP